MHYGNLRIPVVFCPLKQAFLGRFSAPAAKNSPNILVFTLRFFPSEPKSPQASYIIWFN